MKKIYISIIMLLILLTLTGCKDNDKKVENISVNRASTSITNNEQQNQQANATEQQQTLQDEPAPSSEQQQTPQDGPATSSEQQQTQQDQQNTSEQPKETVAAEFSTQIKTKSKNRAKNIEITCGKINNVTVKSGTEFSFCKTTGVSKESEGYEKADVIVNKKTVHALGGGNCQVSTTLYNAVLAVSDLEVTERHPHGKKVNYVPEGKDAAIAHGSKDLRFKNNSEKDLKIYASSDGKTVSVKLVFVE